jgi:lipopolysaccharide export system permease protein
LAVSVVYGRVGGDQELTAAKAAGINPMSLLLPALLLGVVLSGCSFALTDRTIPWAMRNIQNSIARQMESIFLETLRSHHAIAERDRGYSISVKGIRGKTLIEPILQYLPRGRTESVTLQADEAQLQFDLEGQQIILRLVNCHFESSGHGTGYVARKSIPVPFPQKLTGARPRHLGIEHIRARRIESSKRIADTTDHHDIETAMALTQGDFGWLRGPDSTQYQMLLQIDRSELAKLNTELHSRFAMSTSCFFFVLLGAPFAVSQARRQFLTSFFLCFLPILLVYYPLGMLMMNLSKSGTVDPTWAMWISNVLLFFAGCMVMRNVLKH